PGGSRSTPGSASACRSRRRAWCSQSSRCWVWARPSRPGAGSRRRSRGPARPDLLLPLSLALPRKRGGKGGGEGPLSEAVRQGGQEQACEGDGRDEEAGRIGRPEGQRQAGPDEGDGEDRRGAQSQV